MGEWERGSERAREGGREEGREGGRERGRERGSEGGRERGREGGSPAAAPALAGECSLAGMNPLSACHKCVATASIRECSLADTRVQLGRHEPRQIKGLLLRH